MATIWRNLGNKFRRLRWKLTLSYTAVTVGALLVVVVILGVLLSSLLLAPHDVLRPDVLVSIARQNIPRPLRYALSQSPVDTDLLALMLEDGREQYPEGKNFQITYYDLFRLRDLQITARTLGKGDTIIVGADRTLLAASEGALVPREAIGKPIDINLLPGLEVPLRTALTGVADPDLVFVTIEPNERFFLVVPIFGHGEASRRVVGASIAHVETMPTESDIPANTLALVGRSLLVLLLAAGLVGALFGALTANGMVKRLTLVSSASEAWSRGDFSQFIDDTSGDEIGLLSRRLNRMAEQLRSLLERRRALAISEERNRLARDLHDSAKQQALAASFQLGTAITLFDQDPQAAKNHLVEADTLVDAVRKELTGLIDELRPPAMGGRDLSETLNAYAVEWAQQNGIDVDVQVEGPRELPGQPGLPIQLTEALYRIMQEALANIARHSSAAGASVRLISDPDRVTLTITDDGCGFDSGPQHGGMGLQSMRERAEALGGHFVVESEPGKGTRLSVTLPLQGASYV
jgi:signal transduction histidine kinase